VFASGYASGPVEQLGKLKNSTRKAEYKFAADLITKQCKLLLIAGRHPYKLSLPVIADDPHWSAIYDNKSTFN